MNKQTNWDLANAQNDYDKARENLREPSISYKDVVHNMIQALKALSKKSRYTQLTNDEQEWYDWCDEKLNKWAS